MEISGAQKRVDKWIRSYGVRYFNELTNLAILMEEVGELSRIFSRRFGEQSFKKEITETQISELINEEMADVLFVLICLANQLNIDLEEALEKSLEKKSKRDFQRHKDNIKLQE